MQIFLIRHPEPAIAPSLCYGKTDIALSEQALVQLDTLALTLKQQLPVDIPVYCSPLTRCRLLADKLHAQPVVDERLIEMDFGYWEMQAWDLIPRVQIDGWAAAPLDFVIPGGESVAQMQERVLHFVHEQQTQGTKKMIIVTHAGVMKILVARTRQLPLNEWLPVHFDYGSLQVVDFP